MGSTLWKFRFIIGTLKGTKTIVYNGPPADNLNAIGESGTFVRMVGGCENGVDGSQMTDPHDLLSGKQRVCVCGRFPR